MLGVQGQGSGGTLPVCLPLICGRVGSHHTSAQDDVFVVLDLTEEIVRDLDHH